MLLIIPSAVKMKLSSAICCVFATLTVAFPSDYLKIATWGVEGYAKDNPIGVTTGGKGGKTITVTTAEELVEAVKGNAPKIVKLKGKVVLPARLAVGSNTSLIGVGLSAHITGKGLNVYNGDNVIIQNLKITEILDNDCITIRNSTRVWVDHNEFSSDIDGGPDKYVSSDLLSWKLMITNCRRTDKLTLSVPRTLSPSHGTTSTTTGSLLS